MVPNHCRYTKFEQDLWGARMGAKSLKFWKYYREAKNNVSNFLSFWGQKVSPGWEDPKSSLKIEIGQYLNPFSAKKRPNLANLAILPVFDRFKQFLGANGEGVKFIRFQFWGQIWNPLIRTNLSDPKLKENWNLYFLSPYSISKTSTNLRPSLNLADTAQISYLVFCYHRATFETLTPRAVQKKCFSIHPTVHIPMSCHVIYQISEVRNWIPIPWNS